MLEYLDTFDSDSDFILEEEEPQAAYSVSNSEEDDTDDEDYREILSPEQLFPLLFQFQELSGPKHKPPSDSPPIAYLHLFFTDLIHTLMLRESNRYAQQVISSKVSNVPTPLNNWTRITTHKMKGFLACILNMGIIKKPTIASYWCTSWFWKMFTQHCFSHILCFFHLIKNEELPGPKEPDLDPCARYQHLVDHTGISTPHNKKLVLTKAW
jgi:hypothetical protein